MYGRNAEMAQLGELLRRPDIVGAVLVGAPGVGKTFLLDSMAKRAAELGFVTIRLHASQASAGLPLGVFGLHLPETTADRRSEDRFGALRRALLDEAGSRPLLIGVDDAHLLDDASAVFLAQLARELVAFTTYVARAGERLPDATTALWRDGLVTRLDIGPLTREATALVAAELAGAPLDPALEADIWLRTHGNALYLRELLVAAMAEGTIDLDESTWRSRSPLTAPPALVDLVGARIAHLGDAALQALSAVALAEPVSVATIEHLIDADALIALEEQGLVRSELAGRRLVVRIAHPMYGEVVRARTSPLRARKLRRDLAAATAATGAKRVDDVLAMAVWRIEGGEVEPELFERAAAEAIRRHDPELAERLAAAAYDVAPGPDLARRLGVARHLLGRPAAGIEVLLDGFARAEPGTAARDRVALALGRILARGSGDLDRARQVLGEAVETASTPANAAAIEALIAYFDSWCGRPVLGLERGRRLQAAGHDTPDTHSAIVAGLAATGRPAEACAAAETFMPMHGTRATNIDAMYSAALMEAGRFESARRVLTALLEQPEAATDLQRQSRITGTLGFVTLNLGQLTEATYWFERALRLTRATQELVIHRSTLGGALLVATQARDIDTARRLGAELEDVSARTNGRVILEMYEVCGRAWLAGMLGDRDGAVALLQSEIDRMAGDGCATAVVRMAVDLCRLGDPRGAAERVTPLLGRLDGELLPAIADFVLAVAADDPAGLGRAAEAFAHVGNHIFSVEAANHARDAAARGGDQRAAAGWARRAVELRDATTGVATPMFSIVEAPVPLTRREREIAVLVAEGRTSREVAEACFLSVRTVENHLARIYDKLGTRSRTELARALGRELLEA